MTSWPVRSLGEIVRQPLTNGRSVPTRVGGFPVLRLTALKAEGVDLQERKGGAWSREEASRFLVAEGDFLVARGSGSLDLVGRGSLVRRMPDEVAFPDTAIRIRPRVEQISPEYLSLLWNSPMVRIQVESMARTTAGIYKVNQSHLYSVRLPVPTLGEQRRIVDILEDHLSRLGAAVHEISVSRQRLEGLRDQLVMDALTGRAVTAARHTSVPQGVGANDGVLPELPLGWTWSRLEDVADVVGGVTKDAKKQSDPGYVEVPYLRVANVQRGRLALDSITTIKVAPAKVAALRLQPGDVLLNEGGDRDKLARGWVWEGQIESCIHQNHVFRARVRDEIVDPYFLSWTANTLGGKWAERNGKQSVNLASISLTMIRKMPVIIPPLGTSSQIVDRLHSSLGSLNRLDAALDSAAQRSRSLRQALLAAAFSGRLTGWTSDLDLAEETATEAFQSDSAAILG